MKKRGLLARLWPRRGRRGSDIRFVRCVYVDHDGFNGRDNHPDDVDLGKLFAVIGLYMFDVDEELHDPLSTWIGSTAADYVALKPEQLMTVLECVGAHGRRVTFLGHEVEWVD